MATDQQVRALAGAGNALMGIGCLVLLLPALAVLALIFFALVP